MNDNRPRMISTAELHNMCGITVCQFRAAFLGGSRATVTPPPTDTDCDIFIHCADLASLVSYLYKRDWDVGGQYVPEGATFCTFRKGEYNLLVFQDAYEFGAAWGATWVAKARNLQTKEERYELFEQARAPWRHAPAGGFKL